MPKMDANKYAKQKNYAARQKQKGLVLLQRWIDPIHKPEIDALIKQLTEKEDGNAIENQEKTNSTTQTPTQ